MRQDRSLNIVELLKRSKLVEKDVIYDLELITFLKKHFNIS